MNYEYTRNQNHQNTYSSGCILPVVISPSVDVYRMSTKGGHMVVLLRGCWWQWLFCLKWDGNVFQVSPLSSLCCGRSWLWHKCCRRFLSAFFPRSNSFLYLQQHSLASVMIANLLGKGKAFIRLWIKTLDTSVLKLSLRHLVSIESMY